MLLGTENGIISGVKSAEIASSCRLDFGGMGIIDTTIPFDSYGVLTVEGKSFNADSSDVKTEVFHRKVIISHLPN